MGRRYFVLTELKELAAPRVTKPVSLEQAEWDNRVKIASLHCAAHASLIRDFVLVAHDAGHHIDYPDHLLHLFAKEDPPGAVSYMARFFNGLNLRTASDTPRLDSIFAVA
jgi:hypothetical protein